MLTLERDKTDTFDWVKRNGKRTGAAINDKTLRVQPKDVPGGIKWDDQNVRSFMKIGQGPKVTWEKRKGSVRGTPIHPQPDDSYFKKAEKMLKALPEYDPAFTGEAGLARAQTLKIKKARALANLYANKDQTVNTSESSSTERKLAAKNDLAKQGLVNQGNLDAQKARNESAIALENVQNKNKFAIEKYKAQLSSGLLDKKTVAEEKLALQQIEAEKAAEREDRMREYILQNATSGEDAAKAFDPYFLESNVVSIDPKTEPIDSNWAVQAPTTIEMTDPNNPMRAITRIVPGYMYDKNTGKTKPYGLDDETAKLYQEYLQLINAQ